IPSAGTFFRLSAMRTRKLASDRQNEKNFMGGNPACFFPSPLVGEGGFAKRRRVRGLSPRMQTPHPALRATFSHKGRREGSTYYAPTAFLRQARCTAQVQPGGCEATSLAGTISATAGAFAAACSCEGM